MLETLGDCFALLTNYSTLVPPLQFSVAECQEIALFFVNKIKNHLKIEQVTKLSLSVTPSPYVFNLQHCLNRCLTVIQVKTFQEQWWSS